MQPLDRYLLNEKLTKIRKVSWILLTSFSKLVLGAFLVITAIVFWMNTANQLYLEFGLDISQKVDAMFLIVTIVSIIICADFLVGEDR